jgi:hypothetical protein
MLILSLTGQQKPSAGSVANQISAPSNSTFARSVTTATPEERVIAWREVDSIYNLKSHNTDLQKEEEWKHFQGKQVYWSGTVTSVSEGWTGFTLQVKMNPDTFTSDLLIKLKKSERPKALRLRKGERVTFSGKLENWGTLLPITLTEGEITE